MAKRKMPLVIEEDEIDGALTDGDFEATPDNPSLKPSQNEIRFSMQLAEKICESISIGKPLQAICTGEDMPTVPQVIRWIRKYAKFGELYEQARVLQADYLADEALVIVQEMRANPGRAPALKAAADLLAKQAEWRSPRKYGPRMDLTMTERPKTPDEIKAEIGRLRTELGVPEGRIARIK